MTNDQPPAKQPRPRTSVGMIILLVIIAIAIIAAIIYFGFVAPELQRQAEYNEQVSERFCQMIGGCSG